LVGNKKLRLFLRKGIPATRSIGDGLLATGYRVFRTNNKGLVSWSQRRCKACGKFLSKRQKLYCEAHGVGSKAYLASHKEEYHIYNKKYRETHHEQEIERHTKNNRKRIEKNCLASFQLLLSKARNSGVIH
jgi:hypothetical protein